MCKRSILAILFIMPTLVFMGFVLAWGDDQDGNRLLRAARELHKKARSHDDLKKASEAYLTAIRVSEEAGAEPVVAEASYSLAGILSLWGDYHNAAKRYQTTLEIAKKRGNTKSEAKCLAHLGYLYAQWGQLPKAEELSQRALKLARELGDPATQARALDNLAFLATRTGGMGKAIEYLQEAVLHAQKASDASLEASLLKDLAMAQVGAGQYRLALENCQKSLEICEKKNLWTLEGRVLNNMGQVLKALGKYKEAANCLEKALKLKEAAQDLGAEVTTLGNLGLLYCRTGQYDKAIEYFQRALERSTKTGNMNQKARSLNNLGLVYAALGQYDKSLNYYEDAIQITRQTGDTMMEARVLNTLGLLYSSWGQFQSAADYYSKSLAITSKAGSPGAQSDALCNLGEVYRAWERYDKALECYLSGLEIMKGTGAPTERILDLIGNLYLDLGQMEKAEPYIQQGSRKASIARFHLLKGEYAAAADDYQKLLILAEKSGNVDSRFTAYTGLGRVHEQLEEYEKAEEYYGKAMQLAEDIRSSMLPTERKSFFEVKINGFSRSDPAKGLTRVRMKLNRSVQSIDSSEATRARSFADNLSARMQGGNYRVPEDVVRGEDELVTRLASLKKDRNSISREKDRERYQKLETEIRSSEEELDSFVATLWEKYPAYAAVKYPRPVTLSQAAIGPEEHIVVFDVLGDGVA